MAIYTGLTPWVQTSNEYVRYGKITKRGPTELRTALIQIVLGLVRLKNHTGSYRLMQRYDRMKKEKGSGRSIVATARVLSEIIWHMLTKQEPFDEARMIDPALFKKSMEMHKVSIAE